MVRFDLSWRTLYYVCVWALVLASLTFLPGHAWVSSFIVKEVTAGVSVLTLLALAAGAGSVLAFTRRI